MTAPDTIYDRELRDLVHDLHRAGDVLVALENGAPPHLLGIASATGAVQEAAQKLTDIHLALHDQREQRTLGSPGARP
jgi:hypothetical protein